MEEKDTKPKEDVVEDQLENLVNNDDDFDIPSTLQDEHQSITEELAFFKEKKMILLGQNFPSILNNPQDRILDKFWIEDWVFTGTPPVEITMYKEPDIDTIAIRKYMLKMKKPYINFRNNLIQAFKTHEKETDYMERINDPLPYLFNEDHVPQCFFEDSFEDKKVSWITGLIESEAPFLQHEKLTHYVDRVEQRLGEQIAFRSRKVLKNMAMFKQLNDQLNEILPQIKELRSTIQRIQINTVVRPMRVNKMVRRKQNLERLLFVLERVYSIQRTVRTIHKHINNQNFVKAMQQIDKTIEFVSKSEIRQLHCIQRVQTTLETIKTSQMSNIKQLFIQRSLNISDDTQSKEDYRNDIYPCIDGLISTGRWNDTMKSYTKKLLARTKLLFKKVIDNSVDEMMSNFDLHEGKKDMDAMAIANMISNLSSTQFIAMISLAFNGSMKIIQRSLIVHHMILERHADAMASLSIESPVLQLFELSQNRFAMIYGLRSEAHQALSRDEFHELLEMSISYIHAMIDCCQKNQKMNITQEESALYQTLLQQGQTYMQHFHKTQTNKLLDILQSETWVWMKDVPLNFQNIVYRMEGKKVNDVDWDPEDATQQNEYIIIDQEKFPCTSCIMLSLKYLWEYFVFLKDPRFERIYQEQQHVLFLAEFCKLFNRECHELVLGAKAIKTAKLPKITTKHLLVASESLHILMKLIDVLSNVYQVDKTSMRTVYEHLEKHREGIFTKIKGIMKHRLRSFIQKWAQLPWGDVNLPSSQMVLLLKDLQFLQKVLSTYLNTHPALLQSVFSSVVETCYQIFEENIHTLKITLKLGKEQMTSDLSLVGKNVDKWRSMLSTSFDPFYLEPLLKQRFVDTPTIPVSDASIGDEEKQEK